MDEDAVVKKAMEALIRELGPVEAIRGTRDNSGDTILNSES